MSLRPAELLNAAIDALGDEDFDPATLPSAERRRLALARAVDHFDCAHALFQQVKRTHKSRRYSRLELDGMRVVAAVMAGDRDTAAAILRDTPNADDAEVENALYGRLFHEASTLSVARWVLTIHPTQPRATRIVAVGLSAKKPAEAAELLERVVAMRPRYVWAWYNLAEALARLKRDTEALAALQRALTEGLRVGNDLRGHARVNEAFTRLASRPAFRKCVRR